MRTIEQKDSESLRSAGLVQQISRRLGSDLLGAGLEIVLTIFVVGAVIGAVLAILEPSISGGHMPAIWKIYLCGE